MIQYYVRGMFKNNVDFCYKKLSSQHRLMQTIPFRFGNRMGSENTFCTNFISFSMVTGTRGSPIICTLSTPLTAYKTIINQRICLKFCHNEVLCHNKVSVENEVIRLFQKEVNNFLRSPILTSRLYVMAAKGLVENHAIIQFCRYLGTQNETQNEDFC